MEKIKKAVGFVFAKDTLVKILLVQVILTLFAFSTKGIPLRLKNNYIPIRLSAGYSAVKVDLSGGGYSSSPIEVKLDGGLGLSGDLMLDSSSSFGFPVQITK